jgi:ribosomal protein L29
MKKKETTNAGDVDAKLLELHEKVRVSRFALAGSRAKNVKATKTHRREIARLMTQKNATKK